MSLGEALDLLASGVGLVIRRAEKIDDGIAGLATSVTQHIPGKVHVQLIVTPAGTYGLAGIMTMNTFSSYRPMVRRTIFLGTIRSSVNGRRELGRISLDSAMKIRRWARLGCWQVISYIFPRVVACGKMHRGFTIDFTRHFPRLVVACQ